LFEKSEVTIGEQNYTWEDNFKWIFKKYDVRGQWQKL
jgi:hypothetical protein